MNMNTLKSIGAVLAGFITIFILSNGMDKILEGTGVFPTVDEQLKHGFTVWWMQALTLFYRIIFTAVGGYVTAKLAPSRPMRHVIILATIGTVPGAVASLAVASMGIFPVWYSVALVAIGFPSVWLGGKLALNGKSSSVMAAR